MPDSITKANNLNTFKHYVKKHYLTWITHNMFMWVCESVYLYVCMSMVVCIHTFVYVLVYFPLSYTFSWFFSHLFFSHNENKAILAVLCNPSHCWCYSYLSQVVFQLQLLYFSISLLVVFVVVVVVVGFCW